MFFIFFSSNVWAGPHDPVYFADPNLKQSVEDALDVINPTEAQMGALSYLNANNRGIKDLTGLEYATNMVTLILANNSISNISSLSGMTKLDNLNLRKNNIIDINALSGINDINDLDLWDNQIVDISALSNMTNIHSLNLRSNQIIDISSLSGLAKLKILNLQDNQISDIEALSGMTDLEELNLQGNDITDIEAISNITNMLILNLNLNPITDISALSKMTKLTHLQLYHIRITDVSALYAMIEMIELNLGHNDITNISALSNMTKLTFLYIFNNNITDISPLLQMTNLRTLDLTGNNVSDINILTELVNLTDLFLGSNMIIDLNPLGGMVNLETLDLSDNQISDISHLSDLYNLNLLELQDNILSRESYCLWIPLIRDFGTTIEVDPNPFNCSVPANVIYVDDDSVNDPGPNDIAISDPNENGSSEHPFDEITEAINASVYSDEIIIRQGIYYENITLKHGINLLGSGANVAIIDANGYGDVVNVQVHNVTISGLTLRNSGEDDLGHLNCGVYLCNAYSTVIKDNVITNNKIGIGIWNGANYEIKNNTIEKNNDGLFIYRSEGNSGNPTIINNTIVDNENSGIILRVMASPVISNNIITGHIKGINSNYVTGSPKLSYNNLWDNEINYMRNEKADDTLAGLGSISVDPYFVMTGYLDMNDTSGDPNDDFWVDGDYHLKSGVGRWNPINKIWVSDDVNSPCIDAGDPNSNWGEELWPHGQKINMGAYGGTSEASMSSSQFGDARDLNNDYLITWDDVLILAEKWNSYDVPLKEDLDLDGVIDANDLAFYSDWSTDSNNTASVIDLIEDQNAYVGNELSFSVSAIDDDGDGLTYLALGLPDGALFYEQLFIWTPEQVGTYLVTFVVSDYKSLDYLTIQITVEDQ